jgi:hypothetical protein
MLWAIRERPPILGSPLIYLTGSNLVTYQHA